MTPEERRTIIHQIITDKDTMSPMDIWREFKARKGTSLARKTIKDDIEVLKAANYYWMHNQASDQWYFTIRQMHQAKKKRIAQLQSMIDKMLDTADQVPEALTKYLDNFNEDDAEKIKLYLANLHEKTSIKSIMGKIAYVNQSINETEKGLTELMQDKPLYEAVQKYAYQYQAAMETKNVKPLDKEFWK